jgi:predicted dehydrogenase
MSQTTVDEKFKNKSIQNNTAALMRVAFVGIGHRAGCWIGPAVSEYAEHVNVVGLCDPVLQRCHDAIDHWQIDAPCYTDMGQMLAETQPDLTVITSPESVHRQQIVQALHAGSRVATEKPLCVTGEDAQTILEAQQTHGQPVLMGFNYRHIPLCQKIKSIIQSGVIGKPLSVQLNWMLDYHGHGGSYFHRWHGQMAQSGGLLITKATHHFDLVNWWLDDRPVEVYAQCRLNRFGSSNSPYGSDHANRCQDCSQASQCEHFRKLNTKQHSQELGYQVRQVHDYHGDLCVWRDEIDIYDTHALTVQYQSGCVMSYALDATAPYEGWQLVINGTNGRLETGIEDAKPAPDWQKHFVIRKHGKGIERMPEDQYFVSSWPAEYSIHVMPLDRVAYMEKVPNVAEGHGGGDQKIMRDAYLPAELNNETDPLKTRADIIDGARSMAIGAAANQSTKLNRPVRINEILGQWA